MANDRHLQQGVFNLLENLNVPDNPPWRNTSNTFTTSEMLEDIVGYSNDIEYKSEKLKNFKVEYVLRTNQGEAEGTQTFQDTENALNAINEINITREYQVSRNLLDAINHLKERNAGDDKGLLDVEECIQDTHKILMKNLLDLKKCGEFSIERRVATDGHEFPQFDTKEDAYDAVQRVVDQYNTTIDYIKNAGLNSNKEISMYIRCAAWILYHFVSLHPFADGNGRMCRLLASHCLYLVFPFPCPIYNIYAPTTRDDYLEAVKKARRDNGEDLGDLVALLIESGWHNAKSFSESY